MVHGFLRVPGPASDGESFARYPSPPEFAQDGRRVRPSSHVEGDRAARGLHIQTHGGAGGVPWGSFLGSAAALPVARRARRASGATEASLARPFARPSACRSLIRWAFLESYGPLAAERCSARPQERADTLLGLPKPSPGLPGRGLAFCARMLPEMCRLPLDLLG